MAAHEEPGSLVGLRSVLGQDPDEFLAATWGRNEFVAAGHLPAGQCGKPFVELLEHLFESAWITPNILRIVENGRELPAESYCTRKKDGLLVVDHERVMMLFTRGNSIVFNSFEKYWQPVFQNCQLLENFFQCPVDAALLLTPPGRRGLTPHYDGQDVFVHQMAGSKQWNIWSGPVGRPTDGMPHPEYRGTDPDRQLVLTEGDAFYLPRGTVHECVAVEAMSAHITYIVEAVTLKDVAVEAFRQALDTPELRRSLSPGWATSGLDSASAIELCELAEQGVKSLDVAAATQRLAQSQFWDRRVQAGSLRTFSELPKGIAEGGSVRVGRGDTERAVIDAGGRLKAGNLVLELTERLSALLHEVERTDSAVLISGLERSEIRQLMEMALYGIVRLVPVVSTSGI